MRLWYILQTFPGHEKVNYGHILHKVHTFFKTSWNTIALCRNSLINMNITTLIFTLIVMNTVFPLNRPKSIESIGKNNETFFQSICLVVHCKYVQWKGSGKAVFRCNFGKKYKYFLAFLICSKNCFFLPMQELYF